ncbi:MAG: sulfite exporter TauE/SafE family protein, partial [Pseudoflavonifractor sp.]
MLKLLLYFLIAIGATTAGSMTGMGGGVIIKPLLDLLHGFDVETIGVLSAITVFAMSVVSIGKQMLAKTK